MAEEERVEIPAVLESVLRYCLTDAQERMTAGEEIIPFSALAVGETLFMEEHDADSPEECFADACKTVEHATGAAAYGFCYDGYIDTDEGQRDALIAQGGAPGDATGHAIGLLYTINADDTLAFEEEPVYIDQCENFMAAMTLAAPDDEEAEDEGDAPII